MTAVTTAPLTPITQSAWAPLVLAESGSTPQTLSFEENARHVFPDAKYFPGETGRPATIRFDELAPGVYRLIDPRFHACIGEAVVTADMSRQPTMELAPVSLAAGVALHMVAEPLPRSFQTDSTIHPYKQF